MFFMSDIRCYEEDIPAIVRTAVFADAGVVQHEAEGPIPACRFADQRSSLVAAYTAGDGLGLQTEASTTL